jgi:Tol biopolymer transport system component
MSLEQIVSKWLQAEAPGRAPDRLLTETLHRVAVIPQQRVLRRPVGWPVLGRGAERRAVRFGGHALTAVLVVMVAVVGLALVWRPSGLIGPAPSPSPSPTVTQVPNALVYVLDEDLYVANWDGAEAKVVATARSDAPCGGVRVNRGFVSPDGRYLAYRSAWADGCPNTVFITDLQGHRVASFPGDGWNIAWSPDSTRVATWLEFGNTIGVYGVDGVRQAVLDGSRMCCGDYDPAWSPDGAESLLVWNYGTAWEVPVDGSAQRDVPVDDPRRTLAGMRLGVGYSPDRARAAFVASVLAEPIDPAFGPRYIGGDLVVSAADGSARQVLAAREPGYEFYSPTWSPAGDRIVFAVRDEPGFLGPLHETHEVRFIDVSTVVV